jgi:hypothetical protein
VFQSTLSCELAAHSVTFGTNGILAPIPVSRSAYHAVGGWQQGNSQSNFDLNYRHTLDLHHIIMMNRTGAPVIPIYYHAAPSVVRDRAKIGCRRSPANAVADFEQSRLFAGHFGLVFSLFSERMSDFSLLNLSMASKKMLLKSPLSKRPVRLCLSFPRCLI